MASTILQVTVRMYAISIVMVTWLLVSLKCVAQPGKCPKAPGIGHFEKVEEAQEFLNKLDAKKSSVEYATKDDVKRLEEKLDALLSQNK